jgi:hypothetical protein
MEHVLQRNRLEIYLALVTTKLRKYKRVYMRKWKNENRTRWKEICKGVDRRYRAKIQSLPPQERTTYRKNYAKRRRLWKRKNLHARLSENLRSRLHYALVGCRKSGKTLELLGCSPADLKLHLESQFTPGMSWANYGQWHIDHIKPCAKFDLSKPEEQRTCFHFTNLQPLWALDNFTKGGR